MFGSRILTFSWNSSMISFQAKEFFKTHPTGPGKRAFNQALESIQNHIEWLKKFEPQIVAWLTNYNKMNP